MNKKWMLFVSLVTLGAFSLGAATGTKITATLKQQQINYKGTSYSKEVVEYKGTNYVPLREFSNLLGVSANYEKGIIELGEGASETTTPVSETTPASPAAPVSPAPASQVADKSNPAPVGTRQKVEVTTYAGNYTAELYVKEVIRGAAAWSKIKEVNMFNEAAAPGKEYILAKINMKVLAATSKVDVASFDFNVYSGNGSKYDSCSTVEPSPVFAGALYSGDTLEGWAVFEVDQTDQAPKIGWGQKTDGTGGVWFLI